MSTEWLDTVRNVGMVEWELQSDDVYGAVV
jgi:hypothetical protein